MFNLFPLDLRSTAGRDLLKTVSHVASDQLIAMTERLTRIFSIVSPFAPRFHCVGAEVALDDDMAATLGTSRLSVTGNGEALEAALVSCLGEAADHLSQFERSDDIRPASIARPDQDDIVGGWVGAAVLRAGKSMDWIEARNASTGRAALLPADICVRRLPRRRTMDPIEPLSSGVAAGVTFDGAAARAVLELCERDAAALWWLGGRRPKSFPRGHSASEAGTEILERLRQGVSLRRTILLDITTDLGVPTVAAVSVDRNGRGMACGMAARQAWREAAAAAVLEMCQMELAAPLAEAKQTEGGEGQLNETDRRHLRRAAFAAADCDLLSPRESSRPDSAESPVGCGLDAIAAFLAAHDIRIFLVDLTREELGVPVVRAVSPDLQPFSSAVSTKRYTLLHSKTGGGEILTAGTPLL
jgi:thiazole/oxazole-forming peptide maturase SagD family component